MKKQAIITENNMEYLITSGKRGEKKYCLEVNTSIWEPKYPGDICPEYMLRFCRARGLSDLEWYVNLLEEKGFAIYEKSTPKPPVKSMKWHFFAS